jgi:MFS family permease
MDYIRTLRLFSRNMRLNLAAVALVVGFGFAGIFSLLINLYLLRLGYGIEFIGIFGAVGLLALALFSMPATIIGTRIGSRRAMILCTALMSLGLALLLVAELLPLRIRSAWLLSSYGLTWMGAAFGIVNMNPFIMSNTTPRERNHAFAVNNAVVPLVAVAGVLVGGILPGLVSVLLGIPLDDPAAYRLPLWLVELCYVGGVLLFVATDPKAMEEADLHAAGPARTTAATNRLPYALIGMMMLILFFRLIADTAANGFFAVYLDTSLQVPTSVIGLVSAIARLLAVPAALAAPLMIARAGLGRTFIFSVLILSASLLPLALVPTLPAATIGLLGVVATSAISLTAVTVFHQQSVHLEWRTAMSGGVSMATGIGQGLVSFAGGFLIAAWGFSTFFLGAGALTLVAPVLFWAYFRNSKRAAPPVEFEPTEGLAEIAAEPEAVAV